MPKQHSSDGKTNLLGISKRGDTYLRTLSGQAHPSLDALRNIFPTLHTSTDFLVFDEHERGPVDDLRLQFMAVSQFPDEDRRIVKALLDEG